MKLAAIKTMGSGPAGRRLDPSCEFEGAARQIPHAMELSPSPTAGTSFPPPRYKPAPPDVLFLP